MIVISVVSQKGGSGKTVTTANLGATLANSGHPVLVVDLDPQVSLTTSLNVRERANIFQKHTEPVATQIKHLHLLPGDLSLMHLEHDLFRQRRWDALRELLKVVKGYDFAIVDCPPSVSGSTLNAIVAADLVLIPAPLDGDVIDKVDTTVSVIEELRGAVPGITPRVHGLVTRFRNTSIQRQLLTFATDRYPIWLTTHIRESQIYTRASMHRTPAAQLGTPKSAPVLDHAALAAELRLL